MTSTDFGPVAAGYQAFKGMLFTPSSPETLQRLITWLEHNQQYPMLLQEARKWLTEPIELECDYNRMCIGPTRLLVPPYESVYRDGGKATQHRQHQHCGQVLPKTRPSNR